MAIRFGFYNSLNQDRVYNARDFSEIFNGVIGDGVFGSVGDKFMVTPNTALGNMNILVGTGRAWFNGTWTDNDSAYPILIEPANVSLNRYDSIVLEVNESFGVRANSIKVVQGANSSTAVPPTLTNTDEVHQYLLANIYIPANLSLITTTYIYNKVGQGTCPFVVGLVNTIDVATLVTQWNANMCDWLDAEEVIFDAWFTNLQNQLDSNQASNLQNQIDIIKLDNWVTPARIAQAYKTIYFPAPEFVSTVGDGDTVYEDHFPGGTSQYALEIPIFIPRDYVSGGIARFFFKAPAAGVAAMQAFRSYMAPGALEQGGDTSWYVSLTLNVTSELVNKLIIKEGNIAASPLPTAFTRETILHLTLSRYGSHYSDTLPGVVTYLGMSFTYLGEYERQI